MEKKEMLYEGKAKKVYTTEDPDVLIVSYKDDATAFNGLKKGTIGGKGAINNRMTNFIFKKLEEKGVPTHLVEELNDRETAVRKVEIVPLEVIVRNYSAGSFAKKMGMEEGNARPWNSATRMMTWAIPSSTATMRWPLALPPRRRLMILPNIPLR